MTGRQISHRVTIAAGPGFRLPEMPELPGWETPNQQQDDGWKTVSLRSGLQGRVRIAR